MGKILHASGSGFFPSCIKQVSSIESNFKSTLTNMMAVYWRVSKWRAKISGSAISFFDEDVTFSGTDYNLNRIFGPSTEEELILCAPSPLGFRTDLVPIEEVDGAQFEGQFLLTLDPRRPIQKEAGDLYSIVSEIFVSIVQGSLYVDPPDPEYDLVIGSCVINMAGSSIVTPLFVQSFAYKSGGVQLTFTAREYYSYGGTYNTSTGQPL